MTYLSNISSKNIQEKIEDLYDIDLTTKTNLRDIAYKRFVYFYLCRIFTNDTNNKIGESLGFSHCNVIYGSREVEQSFKYNYDLKCVYDEIIGRLELGEPIKEIRKYEIPQIDYARYQRRIKNLNNQVSHWRRKYNRLALDNNKRKMIIK